MEGLQAVRALIDPDDENDTRTEEAFTGRASVYYEQSFFKETKLTEELIYWAGLDSLKEFRLTAP